MNKNIRFGILSLVAAIGFVLLSNNKGYAQQDPMYSQYMFNHLTLNPAYAGSNGYLSSTLLFRKQWVGVEGAPNTQNFTMHAPTANDKHGFGLSFHNDKIGITSNTAINLTYAYRIHLSENARLALGLQGQIMNWRANFTEIRTTTAGDVAFNGDDNINVWRPNAGAGIFFHTKRLYVGASAPRLIEQSLAVDDNVSNAKQSRHYFFTGGIMLGAEKAMVKFRPSVLAKYHPAAPMQFDLNGHFLFADKFWLGFSYRTEDALVFMAEWNISTWLRIGYAYDYTTSDLNTYSSGSHEFMLGVDLDFHKRGMVSPRYF